PAAEHPALLLLSRLRPKRAAKVRKAGDFFPRTTTFFSGEFLDAFDESGVLKAEPRNPSITIGMDAA
ncbi:hypothetical protein, partial [Hymenobacter koreensis]|uniref:hypothetical protein n=1 Tax=Hymenobacter koreensis TaxID=1084523 RepID=UPI0031F0B150